MSEENKQEKIENIFNLVDSNINANKVFEDFVVDLIKKDWLYIEIDEYGEYVYWNTNKIGKYKNWPKNLDTENFIIDKVYYNCFVGQAGGDWQVMAHFSINYMDDNSNENAKKSELIMFDDGTTAEGNYHNWKKIKKVIINIAKNHNLIDEDKSKLKESSSGDIKTLKKYFDKFNKDFFHNEIPDLEIKLTNKDTEHSKGIAGSFNYSKEISSIHSNKTGKHFNLDDLKNNNHKDDEEERAMDFFISHSFIELPKDVVKKGKYYFCSVLLHEMTHAWVDLCSKSRDKDPHGPTFRKKVDEINKKSNNEYRVAYTEVPQELISDKPLNERPGD